MLRSREPIIATEVKEGIQQVPSNLRDNTYVHGRINVVGRRLLCREEELGKTKWDRSKTMQDRVNCLNGSATNLRLVCLLEFQGLDGGGRSGGSSLYMSTRRRPGACVTHEPGPLPLLDAPLEVLEDVEQQVQHLVVAKNVSCVGARKNTTGVHVQIWKSSNTNCRFTQSPRPSNSSPRFASRSTSTSLLNEPVIMRGSCASRGSSSAFYSHSSRAIRYCCRAPPVESSGLHSRRDVSKETSRNAQLCMVSSSRDARSASSLDAINSDSLSVV